MEASIRYIRSLTGELSPPVLYDLGFAPAVVWLARQIHDQQGIEVELRQHPIAWPPCDDSQILLFIILRDLLTYVAKETRPRVIKILMQMEGKDLRLQVEHDGAGAGDTGGDPPGFALFSLRERLDRIGGTVAVQAPPGRDTVITLTVPLRRDRRLGRRGSEEAMIPGADRKVRPALLLASIYQPLPPPPPPPPPENPPPPLPEDEPGGDEDDEMAPAKELPRLLVKREVWKLSQELPEYQTGE